MDQREKMIELVAKALDAPRFRNKNGCFPTLEENVADILIYNGVVVLPCRCIECGHFDRGRWKCTRENLERTHFNAFCSYGERKGGDE